MNKNHQLAKLLDIIWEEKFMQGQDYVMCICGEKGTGKSRSLLLNIIHYWYRYKLRINNVPHLPIANTPEEFDKLLQKTKPYRIAAIDEASGVLHKRDWATKIVKHFNQKYDKSRERKWFSIFCLPNYFNLASDFRRDHIKYILRAYYRVADQCKKCKKRYSDFEKCPFCGHDKVNRGHVFFAAYGVKKVPQINLKNTFRKIKPDWVTMITEYKGKWRLEYKKIKDKTTHDKSSVFE